MNRALSIIGVGTSALYLSAVAVICVSRYPELQALSLNNLGDFLAGVFGPLAILWLVLGYFQQGIELRQNTEALRLQAEELRNSVEQQKQLVEVSRLQVEAEREVIRFERSRLEAAARPNFVFHGVGASSNGQFATYSSTVKNMGNHATSVTVHTDPSMKYLSHQKLPAWSHGESFRLEWIYETGFAQQSATLTISFVDSAGVPGRSTFTLTPVAGDNHPMVEVVADEA